MDISVITPVYGVEKFIEKSLRSLLTQSKTDGVEFILVNDCTPDNSMEIARRVISEFPHLTVKIVEHKENGGLAVARQSGVDAASGEYMIHIDSDDWCEPTMLEDMYRVARANDADVVVADIYINHPNKQVYRSMDVPTTTRECVAAILEGRLSGSTCNKLTRRSICTDNNLKWVPGLDIAEDWLIYLKIFSYAKRVVYLPKAFLHYFQNSGSLTKRLGDNRLRNYIEADRLASEFLSSIGRYEEYSDSFVVGRVSLLNILVANSRGERQKIYASMYSDVTNAKIAESKKLPSHYKLALSNARSGRRWLANIIYNMVSVAKSVVR